MKIKASILKMLGLKNCFSAWWKGPEEYYPDPESNSSETEHVTADELMNSGFLDGMSTATARILIDRNLPENLKEIYELEELQNQGRYYIAKIVQPGGKVVDRLLVDKLDGTIYYPKGKFCN